MNLDLTKTRLCLILGIGILLLISACSQIPQDTDLRLDLANLQQHWARDIGVSIARPPVFIKETLIIFPTEAPLMALNAETGAERWQLDTPAIFWEDSLSLTLDDILVAGENGRLLAISPKSGIGEWEVNLDGDMLFPPFLDRYVLFTPTSQADAKNSTGTAIFALNASTGETLWRYKTKSKNLITPARGKDLVFVAGNSESASSLYAFSAAKGELRWEYSLDDHVKSLFANDEMVIALQRSGAIIGLDVESGNLVWEDAVTQNSQHLLGWDNQFYIIDEKSMQSSNIQTGNHLWKYETDQGIVQVVIVDGELYVLNSSGNVISLDSQNGHELGRFSSASTNPTSMAIHQNWLYLTDASGIAYAYSNGE